MKDQLFYDINKLPKGYGIITFLISIARMENGTGQDHSQSLEYVKYLNEKIIDPKVGLNTVYGDFLYLYSKEPAKNLKSKFMNMIVKHKNAFQKLIVKERSTFQIHHAFSFSVWNQLYLNYKGDFDADFKVFKKIYNEDPLFQKYMKDDSEFTKRELTEEQIDFFLEEHLMFYFLSKKRISLPNDFVQGREEWVLNCYPGVPLKCEAYTYQIDPFK